MFSDVPDVLQVYQDELKDIWPLSVSFIVSQSTLKIDV